MSNPLFIYKKSTNIIFSLTFAILLPIIVLLFPLFMILFNLIFFPFSLIHEIGHFLTSLLLLPSHEPVIHFQIIGGELRCMCDMSQELLCCWNSILVAVGGTGLVITSVLTILFFLTKIKHGDINKLGKFFLLFGLFSDLPNLFPILPTAIRSPTDGFIIYSFLSQMNLLPLLPSGVSYFFSIFSFFVVLFSFCFLGSLIYQSIILFIREEPETIITDEEKLSFKVD